jgi:uncharacterized protein YutE (UPF0331/DUF86 family)
VTAGAVDDEVVRRHLGALELAVAHLTRHQGLPAGELEFDQDRRWAIERGLLVCAQNALDVASHLCAALGLDVRDYASAIDGLARLGVLDSTFAARFRAIAGFRNVLVHAYLEVDVARLHRFLNESLSDFTAYSNAIREYRSRSVPGV